MVIKKEASRSNQILRWKRQVALQEMSAFNLSTFEQLWKLFEEEKKLVQSSLLSEIDNDKLFQLYEPLALAGTPGVKLERTLPSLVSFLREKKLLVPVLQTRLFGRTAHLIGYIFRLPDKAVVKTTGQIFVKATGAETEALTINLEAEHLESIFDSYPKFAAAVLTPTVTGIMGTLLGAVIGFLAFLGQQRYNRRAEIERKFEEKKIEGSQKIREFFIDEYRRYLDASSAQQEKQNVAHIRQSLIDLGIYAILPRAEINRLNKFSLSKGGFGKVGGRLSAVTQLLESRFNELME